MSAPVVHLSRRYTFAASHRLYADDLSPDQNEAIFGKCANPNGHGHNYGLTVTVAGPVDPDTGFVMPLTELDDAVKRNVPRPLRPPLPEPGRERTTSTSSPRARTSPARSGNGSADRSPDASSASSWTRPRNNRFEYPAAGANP